MEIKPEDLKYLKSKGFTGNTLEAAFDWLYVKHGLYCNSKYEDPTAECLTQLIRILKIRMV